ncbi:universal stress protein UspA [Pseudalgibacter alginicilyticus]|uniref:Universal stress protein UspA n=1 Tax=Pseudalgibacter alginicilyticus TaxID=1736674 RepID=A0A0P0CIF2_9FLAO|nr:universal stress protein [Pseudalgibacter alginicilyticus]ALJ05970.1 universal stress protein UspA [Pseudalgibacter alginicilyticus]
MKKLLVPTDFSPQAEKALKVAAQLARKHHCEIHLLHILELPMNKIDPLSSHNELPEAVFFMKLAHQRFKELIAKDYLQDLTVFEHVEFHEIFKGIFQACKKNTIDLIVMGSHGSNGLKEMLIGSNTEKVVRTSETPVLVIKNEHTIFKANNFVFASDFKDESKIPFEKALKFAEKFESKMFLLMVNTPNKFMTTADAQERMDNFTKNLDFKNYSLNIYNDETIEQGIMNFSQSIKADLIGVSTHGRQGISHFFNGSISEDLVNHAKRPVITFKI